MIETLIVLIVILAAGYAAFWFIDQGVPAPMHMIAKLIVALLGIIAIVRYVLPGLGIH